MTTTWSRRGTSRIASFKALERGSLPLLSSLRALSRLQVVSVGTHPTTKGTPLVRPIHSRTFTSLGLMHSTVLSSSSTLSYSSVLTARATPCTPRLFMIPAWEPFHMIAYSPCSTHPGPSRRFPWSPVASHREGGRVRRCQRYGGVRA